MSDTIIKLYDEIKGIFRENKESRAISHLFHNLYYECENLLLSREKMPLKSQPIKTIFLLWITEN
jgi:hypothetical protein